MRVLHVLDHGLPLQSGYTFRTRAILKAQEQAGLTAAAVTGRRQGEADDDIETVDGITFFRTPPGRGGIVGEIIALARRLGRAVDAFRPDILHAHSPALTGLAALIVARRRRIPLVYEIRAFWEDAAVGNGTGQEGSLRYRLTRALETWVVRRADRVAVICEGLRRDLIARGIPADRILVAPNGVDMAMFGDPPQRDAALADQLQLTDGETIGFIGSFYPYEGLDDLIAAMPAIVAARPAARLLLVGGGPAGESLKAQAAASPAAAHIRFIGRVPHDEVERFYGLIDILAYPRKAMRLTELVTPLKPLEAMAQRRLVAASDIGGHRELIVDGDTGTLFPPDDPAGLAAALIAMLADRHGWEARRSRAAAFVADARNWSSNIRRYLPVYHALAGRREDAPMMTFPRFSTVAGSVPVLGAVAAGLIVAGVAALMPAPLLEGVAVDSGLSAILPAAAPPLGTTARAVLALIGGGAAAALGWASLYLLVGPEGLVTVRRAGDAPRVRRADAHPDAPPRPPLSAADLGSPLMDFRPVERPLPADLDQPLAAFDPHAMGAPKLTSILPAASAVQPATVDPDAGAAAPAPRIRMGDVPPRAAEAVPSAPPSIEALLARLEQGASRRVAMR